MGDISEDARVLYVDEIREQMALPMYLHVSTQEYSYMQAGDRFVMVYEDEDEGVEHWLHEVLCCGYSVAYTVDDLPPLALGWLCETDSMEEVRQTLEKYRESSAELRIAVMLRTDMVEKFVTEGFKSLQAIDSVEEAVDSIGVTVDSDQRTAVTKRDIRES